MEVTVAAPRQPIARTRIVYRIAYGDYQVLAYDAAGERMAAADYFTDDIDDAKATARAMKGEPASKPTGRKFIHHQQPYGYVELTNASYDPNEQTVTGTIVGGHSSSFFGGVSMTRRDEPVGERKTISYVSANEWTQGHKISVAM